jgi:hypothetical protein
VQLEAHPRESDITLGARRDGVQARRQSADLEAPLLVTGRIRVRLRTGTRWHRSRTHAEHADFGPGDGTAVGLQDAAGDAAVADDGLRPRPWVRVKRHSLAALASAARTVVAAAASRAQPQHARRHQQQQHADHQRRGRLDLGGHDDRPLSEQVACSLIRETEREQPRAPATAMACIQLPSKPIDGDLQPPAHRTRRHLVQSRDLLGRPLLVEPQQHRGPVRLFQRHHQLGRQALGLHPQQQLLGARRGRCPLGRHLLSSAPAPRPPVAHERQVPRHFGQPGPRRTSLVGWMLGGGQPGVLRELVHVRPVSNQVPGQATQPGCMRQQLVHIGRPRGGSVHRRWFTMPWGSGALDESDD